MVAKLERRKVVSTPGARVNRQHTDWWARLGCRRVDCPGAVILGGNVAEAPADGEQCCVVIAPEVACKHYVDDNKPMGWVFGVAREALKKEMQGSGRKPFKTYKKNVMGLTEMELDTGDRSRIGCTPQVCRQIRVENTTDLRGHQTYPLIRCIELQKKWAAEDIAKNK
ncbi:hypothetical protein CYMTET_6346 [Cymbomonas tetramitiformis]|uniref:Uncharacterized protein n=1 Tax=Cymbomonas tetramitiformis TaxID=36881 RepID=A0AAE0LIH7_9CHLO|nr:hypothetical protein CYMTET_6346 [Cymbomonas tetramitiformis]